MTRLLRPATGTFPAAAFAIAAFLALATLTRLAAPPPVAARCVEPAPIEQAVLTADVVIVGLVAAVGAEGTRATVQVEEIWRGPALGPEVTVWGGPGGRTSVDRTFEAGIRYLFTITLGENGRLTDSQCSSTTEWDPKLEALRPAGAHPPDNLVVLDPTAEADAGFDPASLVVPAGVALIVAAALLVVGLLARGRQSNR